ncbi:MAG: hypothetical protein KTR15_02505 [Phycisphaeraceae bacterium]|nr:hypothetical protein [Phycisphaeraceae bacterium]
MKLQICICFMSMALLGCNTSSVGQDSIVAHPVPEVAMITFDGMSHSNRKPNGWHAGIMVMVQDGKMVASLPNRHSEVFWTLDAGVQDVALTIAKYAESDTEASARGETHPAEYDVMRIQYWVKYPNGKVTHGLGAYLRLAELPSDLRELFEEVTTHAIIHIAAQRQQ